ncbi:glycosyltransferase family 4 protein [Microbacterium sp. UBA837]|uniref:glycosyltransferase family 4 protein n=1 Tax=Microbacterium sp. UBA837 TaxID=1946956 RepID=UPI0025E118BF|nr:glycosyltransferase family 4 protein [Microbacterium sp. UBA837]
MTRRDIAIVFDCLYPLTKGGGERQYDAFARDLVKRGEQVEYLTARQWEDASPQAPYRVEAITGRLRLYDDAGVRRSAAALRFATGVFGALRRRRRSTRAVIVSGLPVLNVFAARLALVRSRNPLIVDYLEVWGRSQWMEYTGRVMGSVAWLLQRLAIAATPIATCHSRLSAERLRSEGFRGILLVSPGLIDGAAAATPLRPAVKPPFVLYAGRHIADKRVESLPAAVAAARTAVPDLELVILGEGATTEQVRAEVARVGGTAWTRMPGFIEQEELNDLMATAACLTNPSRREGYGLVVVEAAAHGTPVVLVADEGNAATELVDDGVNGYVAASDDAADVATAIVACVRGGDRLRDSTYQWYQDAVQTRTISQTMDAIVAAIDGYPTPGHPNKGHLP